MEVNGVHRSAMYRLSDEIVRIKTNNSSIVSNSKNYWAQRALVRVVAVTGNVLETQAEDQGDTRQERQAAWRAATNEGAASQSATPQRRRGEQPLGQHQQQPVRELQLQQQETGRAGD
jgi:hypothetical protein